MVMKYLQQQLQVLSYGLVCFRTYAKWQKFGATVEERMKQDTKNVTWLAFMFSCSNFEKAVKDVNAQKEKIPSLDLRSWDMDFTATVRAAFPADVDEAAMAWAQDITKKAELLTSTLNDQRKGYHNAGESSWKNFIAEPNVFKNVHATARKYLECLDGDAVEATLKQMLQVSQSNLFSIIKIKPWP